MQTDRIKSTETTISCRIDRAEKKRFLDVLAEYDAISHEPYKYRAGTVLRTLIRAYTEQPETMQMLIDRYR